MWSLRRRKSDPGGPAVARLARYDVPPDIRAGLNSYLHRAGDRELCKVNPRLW